MNLHYFYHELPQPGTVFKATYADETAFQTFERKQSGEFIVVKDASPVPYYNGWFEERGFLYWEYL